MTLFKLVLSHERSFKLYQSIKASNVIWSASLAKAPDLLVIIDSSISVDEKFSSPNIPGWIKYIHAPKASVHEKIDLFLKNYEICSADWIDLCSDEDLFIRKPSPTYKPYSIQLDKVFGWYYFKGPGTISEKFLYLRDLSTSLPELFTDPLGSNDQIERYQMICRFSYPEGFWSMMTGDIFTIRHNLISAIRSKLPTNSNKIDEIFINVFQAFANFELCEQSLRFRNTDNTQALRFNCESENSFKRSFSSVYQDLSQNFSQELHECIEILTTSINIMLSCKSSQPKIYSSLAKKLIELSIRSYSEILSYDFNNSSYIFRDDSLQFNPNPEQMHAFRFNPATFQRCQFQSSKIFPILIGNGINHKIFSILDRNCCFKDETMCKVLSSIPKDYWRASESNYESICF